MIKTINISEEKNNYVIQPDSSYDEILFELINVKGTEGAPLNLQCRTDNQSSFNLTQDIVGFLSETTAKSIQIIFERINSNTWNVVRSGQYPLFKNVDSVLNYDEKIYYIRLRAGNSTNVFKEGILNIYGRNKM